MTNIETLADCLVERLRLAKDDVFQIFGGAHIHFTPHIFHNDHRQIGVGMDVDVQLPDGTNIARFSLTELPGNPFVIISHGVRVERGYGGRGLGTLLHGLRLKAAKQATYLSMVATVRNDNTAEQAILNHHGWQLAYSVTPQAKLFVRSL